MNQINTDKDVKLTIEKLIQAGTSFDIEQLENIYHDELQVIMIDENANTNIFSKADFKALFQSKRNNGEPPLDTWAQFNHIASDEKNAHVLISRKVKLGEHKQKLVLSIDLVKTASGWQVIREVIFAKTMH